MTHIFISYCHKDRDSLDLVLQALKANGLDDEIWFDDDIEAGNQWIPQIDTALREAYAVIVIVTPDSMTSTYVTYEWSSALGSSTTIFPLLLKGKYEGVHKRLLQEHIEDCTKNIPKSLIDLIKSKRSTPPDTNFLNRNILETLMRFRVATLVTLWFYGQIKYFPDGNSWFVALVNGMLDETRGLFSLKLPELILSRAYAFNQKQLRTCRSLILNLEDYWKMFHAPQGEGYAIFFNKPPQDVAPLANEYWSNNLIPLINFFHTNHDFDEDAYDALDTYLSELTKNEADRFNYFFDRTVIIHWKFGDNDNYGKLLQETLQLVINRIRSASSNSVSP